MLVRISHYSAPPPLTQKDVPVGMLEAPVAFLVFFKIVSLNRGVSNDLSEWQRHSWILAGLAHEFGALASSEFSRCTDVSQARNTNSANPKCTSAPAHPNALELGKPLTGH